MNDNQSILPVQEDSGINIWAVFRVLLSKFYLLFLAGVICGGLVFLFVRFCVTPTYESRVSFYVYNTTDASSHSGTINNNDLQAAESLATTYTKILGSNSVLDTILEDLEQKVEITRKDLSKMVKASVVSDTQLLEVVVTSTSPQLSLDIASSFARVAPTEIVRITKAGGVEVVDRPELPTEKASPRTVFDTAIGFLVGVILISVVLIVKMLSDTTIYIPEDIGSSGAITVLGQIPEIEVPEKYVPWTLVKGGTIRYENQTDERK